VAKQVGLKIMKKFLKSIPFLQPAVWKVRERYRQWKNDINRRIQGILGSHKDVFVVQIGSNDGATGDPIHWLLTHHRSWQALLVEPVPFLFERLKKNYPDASRFKFENVAIGRNVGASNFYYVAAETKASLPDLPVWYEQLGSFNREHITRHLGAAIEPFIIQVKIPTVPLAELLKRNAIQKMDLLHIDTEGYDWEVLRQLDLKKFHPAIILFEDRHLSEEAKQLARQFLQDDYIITDLEGDCFCRRKRSAGR
jgi:FkbM family methyltransferase